MIFTACVPKCSLPVFVGNSQSPCHFSLIYSSKVCSPCLILSLSDRTHILSHWQPPSDRPCWLPDSLGEGSQQQAASRHRAMWPGLGDHHFHNEVSTRMTDDVSALRLCLDSEVAETWRPGRPRGNQRAEEMWEMWAA